MLKTTVTVGEKEFVFNFYHMWQVKALIYSLLWYLRFLDWIHPTGDGEYKIKR